MADDVGIVGEGEGGHGRVAAVVVAQRHVHVAVAEIGPAGGDPELAVAIQRNAALPDVCRSQPRPSVPSQISRSTGTMTPYIGVDSPVSTFSEPPAKVIHVSLERV